jgi:hypothetical protein
MDYEMVGIQFSNIGEIISLNDHWLYLPQNNHANIYRMDDNDYSRNNHDGFDGH